MHEKPIAYLEEGKPRDNCAIVGVFSKTQDVIELTINGLVALNHRGQEGAGATVSDGSSFYTVKGSGLAEIVFRGEKNAEEVESLPKSHIAVGNDRYSTSGSLDEMQPFVDDGIAIVHNGNLVNAEQLKDEFDIPDEIDGARSDTRVALAVINKMRGTEEERILQALPLFKGAYSFAFATKDALFASRDPKGFRPLIIGKLRDGGYVVASETAALRSMGASLLREVEPGETIKIDNEGLKTIALDERSEKLSRCIFELIYISRPDSVVFGIPVMEFRRRQGKILARHLPEGVDVIAPVPNSGRGVALGIMTSESARFSGAEFTEVFYPNPYQNIAKGGPRTFILPNGRNKAVTEKYSVIETSVRGKSILLGDDSMVRGSMRRIVQILKAHGAKSVHALIAAPPIRHACAFGVDFGDGELLANKTSDIEGLDVEGIRRYLDLDSLYYISYAELLEAVLGNPVENIPEVFERNDFCGACFTGRYPIETDGTIKKVLAAIE